MDNYTLTLHNLTKLFGRRLIFTDINAEFKSGSIYGFAGSNGSGKSTLAKIVAGVISPTKGKVIHTLNSKIINSDNLHEYLGFVSPYLILYDEFSAEENILHFLKIRGIDADKDKIDSLFNDFNLYDRRNDLLKGYSSGMKQRIKFIFALVHNPSLLVFDEPTSNLDSKGKDTVYKIVEEEAKSKLVILASNEESDLSLCYETVFVEKFNQQEKNKK
ncbi:MAG: ABC transporter ATP-binding protein [Ignavibacteriales bacterium CG18_big_fil_WC_8_21_14_2_50_31_20]|nr:MAG: ABC transporter ATP-binding protein [Ignavibacteriales bacterium CG18_big_fil_WC_8_21_14_2_50_31_20]